MLWVMGAHASDELNYGGFKLVKIDIGVDGVFDTNALLHDAKPPLNARDLDKLARGRDQRGYKPLDPSHLLRTRQARRYVPSGFGSGRKDHRGGGLNDPGTVRVIHNAFDLLVSYGEVNN